MNWQRGFLRALVVLSVLWILGYVALVRPDQLVPTLALSSENRPATQAASDSLARHKGIDLPPKGVYLLDELTRIQRNVRKMRDRNAPEAEINAFLQLEGLTQIEFRHYEAEHLRAQLIDEAHRRIWRHLGLLLGVPLALLVLGTSMVWVRRGFRST